MEQIREHGLRATGQTGAPKDKAVAAAQLRANQTTSERVLGTELGRLPVAFYAQVPLHGFIVDFYAPQGMVAVEVDGSVHNGSATADTLRDDVLRARGIEVLRFSNDEIARDLPRVIRNIKRTVRKRGRRGTRLGELELDYYLFRHGLPDEVPVFADDDVAVAPEPDGRARTPRRPFRCNDCEREFWDLSPPLPACHRNPSHRVVPMCTRCRTRETTVNSAVCETCRDARSAAIESAGPGAQSPTGNLPQARRARRFRW